MDNFVMLGVMVPPDLKKLLWKTAGENQTTLSNFTRQMIMDGLCNFNKLK
jgi:hypothetical protein